MAEVSAGFALDLAGASQIAVGRKPDIAAWPLAGPVSCLIPTESPLPKIKIVTSTVVAQTEQNQFDKTIPVQRQ
jgi:hypothetical protein